MVLYIALAVLNAAAWSVACFACSKNIGAKRYGGAALWFIVATLNAAAFINDVRQVSAA